MKIKFNSNLIDFYKLTKNLSKNIFQTNVFFKLSLVLGMMFMIFSLSIINGFFDSFYNITRNLPTFYGIINDNKIETNLLLKEKVDKLCNDNVLINSNNGSKLELGLDPYPKSDFKLTYKCCFLNYGILTDFENTENNKVKKYLNKPYVIKSFKTNDENRLIQNKDANIEVDKYIAKTNIKDLYEYSNLNSIQNNNLELNSINSSNYNILTTGISFMPDDNEINTYKKGENIKYFNKNNSNTPIIELDENYFKNILEMKNKNFVEIYIKEIMEKPKLLFNKENLNKIEEIQYKLKLNNDIFKKIESVIVSEKKVFNDLILIKEIIYLSCIFIFIIQLINIQSLLTMFKISKKDDFNILYKIGFNSKQINIINHMFITKNIVKYLLIGFVLGILISLYINEIVDFFETYFNIQIFNKDLYFLDFIPVSFNYQTFIVFIVNLGLIEMFLLIKRKSYKK